MIALKKIATISLLCLAAATAKGLIFPPGETKAHELTLTKAGDSFKLDSDPVAGKVAWKNYARENRRRFRQVKSQAMGNVKPRRTPKNLPTELI